MKIYIWILVGLFFLEAIVKLSLIVRGKSQLSSPVMLAVDVVAGVGFGVWGLVEVLR